MTTPQQPVAPASAAGPAATGNVVSVDTTRYFLLIDGTGTDDSVRFGAGLTKAGWKNLLAKLPVATDSTRRRTCKRHPYMPMWKMAVGSDAEEVVCVQGEFRSKDSRWRGKDAFWKTYSNEGGTGRDKTGPGGAWTDPDGDSYAGRVSAWIQTINSIWEITVRPWAVYEEAPKKPGAPADAAVTGEWSLYHPETPDADKRPRCAASLVFLSSHGWLSGTMAGEWLDTADPAAAAGEPLAEQMFAPRWLSAGMLSEGGKLFEGVEVLILAQCSTANRATWELWATVMARSKPVTRFLLGYENSSPYYLEAATISQAFFTYAATMPILDAWRKANSGRNWAALVHKDALKDTLEGVYKLPKGQAHRATPVIAGATMADYVGFLSSDKGTSFATSGRPVEAIIAPFQLRLFIRNGEITPANMMQRGMLRDSMNYAVSVSTTPVKTASRAAPVLKPETTGKKIKAVTLTWIHIRPNYSHQLEVGLIFDSTSFELFTGSTPPKADANGTVEVLKNSMVITGFAPSPTVTLRLNTMADISAVPHLEAHHSYLWLQIRATLEDDTEHTCDVQTIGLDYLG